MPIPNSELVSGGVSFLLTLMILSYLIGDNPFFRVAVYLFVGVSGGYATAVAWHQVLWPQLFMPLLYGSLWERVLALVALVLGGLLLLKLFPRASQLGSAAIAFLVGVGAAVAVGGAIMGTLFPQTEASINMFNLLGGSGSLLSQLVKSSIILAGTLTTLIYFQFSVRAGPKGPRPNKLVGGLGWIGQVFIAITLGVLFAGVYTAAITALIERLNFLWTFVISL
jgi:hypothetical protein